MDLTRYFFGFRLYHSFFKANGYEDEDEGCILNLKDSFIGFSNIVEWQSSMITAGTSAGQHIIVYSKYRMVGNWQTSRSRGWVPSQSAGNTSTHVEGMCSCIWVEVIFPKVFCHPIALVLTATCWWGYLVGGFNTSEKYERQLGWLFPIYGKIKHVPVTTNQRYTAATTLTPPL